MRYLCRTAHLPGDGIIACNVLFFFAFLASLREQLPILGSSRPGIMRVTAVSAAHWCRDRNEFTDSSRAGENGM